MTNEFLLFLTQLPEVLGGLAVLIVFFTIVLTPFYLALRIYLWWTAPRGRKITEEEYYAALRAEREREEFMKTDAWKEYQESKKKQDDVYVHMSGPYDDGYGEYYRVDTYPKGSIK